MLTLNGSGITFGGNALTFDGAGDITLAIALGGASGFTKTGLGTLTLGAALNTTGTITLAGGTLDLGGFTQTIGTLQVTGDSILDFSGTSNLNLTTLSVAAGVKLTVVNWVNAVDYFYATNSPGATVLDRVEFSGFTTVDTKWLSYDRQITPVPEPSTYGAVFAGVMFALYGWRRARAASASKSA
jgi:autotransporter-associated beta strand protein